MSSVDWKSNLRKSLQEAVGEPPTLECYLHLSKGMESLRSVFYDVPGVVWNEISLEQLIEIKNDHVVNTKEAVDTVNGNAIDGTADSRFDVVNDVAEVSTMSNSHKSLVTHDTNKVSVFGINPVGVTGGNVEDQQMLRQAVTSKLNDGGNVAIALLPIEAADDSDAEAIPATLEAIKAYVSECDIPVLESIVAVNQFLQECVENAKACWKSENRA